MLEYFDFQPLLYEKDINKYNNGIEKPDRAESNGNQSEVFYSQSKRQDDSK